MSKYGPISLTYRDHDGRSALFMAINSGSYELGHVLVHRILNSRMPDSRNMALQLLCRPNNANVTPLWLASLYGDLASMEWILSILRKEFGYSDDQIAYIVNLPDCRNASPLFAAVQEGNAECIRCLIANGADIDFEPRAGLSITSPLVKACAFGNLEIVKILLHSGAKRNDDLHTLTVATAMEQRHIVRYLERTRGFVSRLHHAEELPPDLVLDLLRAGCDIHCSADPCPDITPLSITSKRLKSLSNSGEQIPVQIDYVVRAGQEWNPENHCTFPHSYRSLAVGVFMSFAYRNFANVPSEVWTSFVLPFFISRDPPISNSEQLKIRPGDGRRQVHK